MLAKLFSGAVLGLDATVVTVEVDISGGSLPGFTIVGLPDKAVEESRERVRAAIKNSGAEFQARRITVNLAPADLPKVGPCYDLPIALGILRASEQLESLPQNAIFLGELSLDGTLKHTNGILPYVIMAREKKFDAVYLPAEDAKEGALIQGISIYPVPSLRHLIRHLQGTEQLEKQPSLSFDAFLKERIFDIDMADVIGQEQAKRALEIASAGGHNIFLRGLPGAGKTMLARVVPTILPPLTEPEAIDVTKIYSVTGNLPSGTSLMTERPFRSPHHTTSQIGLIGGGKHPLPGEISLAHRGVLFLDEFPEFPRSVLEALRQPMEDGVVTISRAAGTVSYPAKFLLVAAANPCPCGNYGSETKKCTCSSASIVRYQQRISGPILDRIDLHIHVPAVSTEKLTQLAHYKAESSFSIRSRVIMARTLQEKRFFNLKIHTNTEMSTKMVKECCPLTEESQKLLSQAITKFNLSARSYYRVIKVARTIADLAQEETISLEHISEALMYRPREE